VAPLLQEAIRRWSVTAGTDVAQSLEGVEAGVVTIGPCRLHGVAADPA